MKPCIKNMLTLYAVTDRAFTGRQTLLEQIKAALKGGITCLQLREKNLSREEFLSEAQTVKKLCDQYQVPLIINDDVEIALSCGAAGVHVGQSDASPEEIRKRAGNDFIIGVTAKTVAQAETAWKNGADYLGAGAMFPTTTKTDTYTIPHETIRQMKEKMPLPIVVIGGISPENIETLSGIPLDGAALAGGIFSADDIEKRCRSLKQSVEAIACSVKTAVTIAGSDSSGGAGIQADLKTMLANNVFGMTAITALTAQNTTGVQGIFPVSPEFLARQIDSVFTDIYPDAVKIGMISNKELMEVIIQKLSQYKAKNIVIDPVITATSGAKLLASGDGPKDPVLTTLKTKLLPLADLATPNIPEAEILSGISIHSADDMEQAAKIIQAACGCNVLIKGGHSINDSNDFLLEHGNGTWLSGKRIPNPNTHGTGCTLSSAIASNLAKGQTLLEAVTNAKKYIEAALSKMLNLGNGSGPLNHRVFTNAAGEVRPSGSCR